MSKSTHSNSKVIKEIKADKSNKKSAIGGAPGFGNGVGHEWGLPKNVINREGFTEGNNTPTKLSTTGLNAQSSYNDDEPDFTL